MELIISGTDEPVGRVELGSFLQDVLRHSQSLLENTIGQFLIRVPNPDERMDQVLSLLFKYYERQANNKVGTAATLLTHELHNDIRWLIIHSIQFRMDPHNTTHLPLLELGCPNDSEDRAFAQFLERGIAPVDQDWIFYKLSQLAENSVFTCQPAFVYLVYSALTSRTPLLFLKDPRGPFASDATFVTAIEQLYMLYTTRFVVECELHLYLIIALLWRKMVFNYPRPVDFVNIGMRELCLALSSYSHENKAMAESLNKLRVHITRLGLNDDDFLAGRHTLSHQQ